MFSTFFYNFKHKYFIEATTKWFFVRVIRLRSETNTAIHINRKNNEASFSKFVVILEEILIKVRWKVTLAIQFPWFMFNIASLVFE